MREGRFGVFDYIDNTKYIKEIENFTALDYFESLRIRVINNITDDWDPDYV